MDYSSDDEASCPLCTEELDVTDIHFKPCPCGYQVSLLQQPNPVSRTTSILTLSLVCYRCADFVGIRLWI